jgi:hypothetical protein
MMATSEHFSFDNVGGIAVARGRNPFPRRPIVDCRPIDRRIGQNHTQTPSRGAALIDVANRGEEPFVDRCVPYKDIDRLAPDWNKLLAGYGLARDVPVNHALVSRVPPLDNDIASAGKKGRVSNQRDEDIVDLLVAVHFSDGDDAMVLERVDNPGHGRPHARFRKIVPLDMRWREANPRGTEPRTHHRANQPDDGERHGLARDDGNR